jgi:hypothetical protein
MFAGHKLAIALGVVDASAVRGDDDLGRRQLIRAGEAMVDAGLAVVVNRAGTKEPICTLTAREKKVADQEARDAAAERGDPRSHLRTHRCGLAHAITDSEDAKRILTRLARRSRFNLGVEPRASNVLIVDLDTRAQARKFALRCGADRPELTVRSPGKRDDEGNWMHRDGGHIWFEIPEDVELPTERGKYTHADGWTAMWGECQVLVPPSYRDEGDYVLVGSTHPLPDWLLELIWDETEAWQKRREKARKRRETEGPSAIDDWAVNTPWAEILEEDGWTETNLVDTCACPVWTAPGDHGSPKSATAHEPGCDQYPCDRGHGPLHVWTDFPSDAVQAAILEYGTNTLTKIQVYTWTHGTGDMSATLDELGVERDPMTEMEWFLFGGPGDADDHQEPAASSDEEDDDADDERDDEDEEDDEQPERRPDFDERMIRQEYRRELWKRAARERLAAEDAPPLRWWGVEEYLSAPRPVPLVRDMLYRDSLARIFGEPGCGKSFLALDIALCMATGRSFDGHPLERERVVYVMAEGQAVNGDRTEAWMSRNGVDSEDLRDWFFVVPDAVMLTETAAAPFIAKVAEVQPALVVLDTKNAMMVGEENSATDFAALRRVMDRIRKAADCCVVLIDHTGYEASRARGSSAGTAAMDTEIRVRKDTEKPPMVTAEVTRDKAAESGTVWAWHLIPESPAAVLMPTDVPDETNDALPDWMTDTEPLPLEIERYEGSGQSAVPTLARYMRLAAANDIGRSLTTVRRDLKISEFSADTIDRAWVALKKLGFLVPAYATPTDAQDKGGHHRWVVPQ